MTHNPVPSDTGTEPRPEKPKHLNQPILVVDTDAISDLDTWHALAEAREWDEFFSHIPDALPRENNVLDALYFAQSEGCWLAYASRWDEKHRAAVRAWLTDNDFPHGALHMRRERNMSPDYLLARQAQNVARKAAFYRPVILVAGNAELAEQITEKRGVVAVSVEDVPDTVSGLRYMLKAARKITPPPPRKDKKEETRES